MWYEQRSSRSKLCKRSLITSSDCARSEESPILKHGKWLKKGTVTKPKVLSCQCYTFCSVCKGNKFVCCRHNNNSPATGKFCFLLYRCNLFTLFTSLGVIFCNSITYCLCRQQFAKVCWHILWFTIITSLWHVLTGYINQPDFLSFEPYRNACGQPLPWPLYLFTDKESQDIHQHNKQEAWVQEDEEEDFSTK